MSDDAKAAKELVETLKDGERGFAAAAEKLRDGERPEWATTLQRLSEQREGFGARSSTSGTSTEMTWTRAARSLRPCIGAGSR